MARFIMILALIVSFTGFSYTTTDLTENSKNKIEVSADVADYNFVSVEIVETFTVPTVYRSANFGNIDFPDHYFEMITTGRKHILKPPLSITKQSSLKNKTRSQNNYNLSGSDTTRRARDGLTKGSV